jgi:cobalamin biosynthesis protein CobD/CbiB
LLRRFGSERQREQPVNGIGIDLDFSAAAVAFGAPPIFVFLIAVIVDTLVGSSVRERLPLVFRPLAVVDQFAGELQHRLNHNFRNTATRLILLLMLGVPAAFAAAVIARPADARPFVWIIELVVVARLVAMRAPLNYIRTVRVR